MKITRSIKYIADVGPMDIELTFNSLRDLKSHIRIHINYMKQQYKLNNNPEDKRLLNFWMKRLNKVKKYEKRLKFEK